MRARIFIFLEDKKRERKNERKQAPPRSTDEYKEADPAAIPMAWDTEEASVK